MEYGDLVICYDKIADMQLTGEIVDVIEKGNIPDKEQQKYFGLLGNNKVYEVDRLIIGVIDQEDENRYYIIPFTDRWEIEIL